VPAIFLLDSEDKPLRVRGRPADRENFVVFHSECNKGAQ
jgi:hypothetical protein